MRRWVFVGAWCALLCPISSMGAQRPISIGIAGGASIPEGNLGEGVDIGWHALGTLWLSTLMQPLGLRLDVAYSRFALSEEAQASFGEDGHQDVGSATLNATYRLPMTNSPFSPYLSAGVGAYRSECSVGPGCDATTRYGWNVGLGTRMYVLGFRSFLEARYHRTERGEEDVHFLPVTFGVLF